MRQLIIAVMSLVFRPTFIDFSFQGMDLFYGN